MARRSKIQGKTRSDYIKEYLQEHPSDGPKAVVEALKEKGVEVSLGLVSQVKYSSDFKLERPIMVDDLLALKEIAQSLGSIAKLREAVDKLEEMFDGKL